MIKTRLFVVAIAAIQLAVYGDPTPESTLMPLPDGLTTATYLPHVSFDLLNAGFAQSTAWSWSPLVDEQPSVGYEFKQYDVSNYSNWEDRHGWLTNPNSLNDSACSWRIEMQMTGNHYSSGNYFIVNLNPYGRWELPYVLNRQGFKGVSGFYVCMSWNPSWSLHIGFQGDPGIPWYQVGALKGVYYSGDVATCPSLLSSSGGPTSLTMIIQYANDKVSLYFKSSNTTVVKCFDSLPLSNLGKYFRKGNLKPSIQSTSTPNRTSITVSYFRVFSLNDVCFIHESPPEMQSGLSVLSNGTFLSEVSFDSSPNRSIEGSAYLTAYYPDNYRSDGSYLVSGSYDGLQMMATPKRIPMSVKSIRIEFDISAIYPTTDANSPAHFSISVGNGMRLFANSSMAWHDELDGIIIYFDMIPGGLIHLYYMRNLCTGCIVYLPNNVSLSTSSCSALLTASGSFYGRVVVQIYTDRLSMWLIDHNSSAIAQCINNQTLPSFADSVIAKNESTIRFVNSKLNQFASTSQDTLVTLKSLHVFNVTSNSDATSAATTKTGTTSTKIPSATTSSTITTTTITEQITKQSAELQTIKELDVFNPSSLPTDFPFEPMPVGSMYPTLSIEDLLVCKGLSAENRSPANGTLIYLTFSLKELVETNDLQRSASFMASLFLQWKVSHCAAETTAPTVTIPERIVSENEPIWRPSLIAVNASADFKLQSDELTTQFQLGYFPTTPYRTINFNLNKAGVLTTKCQLNLEHFPFDYQQCYFTFSLTEPVQFVSFGGAYLATASFGQDFDKDERWILINATSVVGTISSYISRSSMSSYVRVEIKMRRNPNYYLINMLAPCYVLVALVFCSFALPNGPDRSAFSATMLLSIMVTQSSILNQVPQTSKKIFLADYIQLLTALCAVITMSQNISAAIPEHIGERSVSISRFRLLNKAFKTKLSVVRLFDLSAFLFTIGLWSIIHIYAALESQSY